MHERALIQNELIKDEWIDTAECAIRKSEFGKATKIRGLILAK